MKKQSCCHAAIHTGVEVGGGGGGLWNWLSLSERISVFHNWTNPPPAELLPLSSPRPGRFLLHLDVSVTLDFRARPSVPLIYVLLSWDKGCTQPERWKATPCTYTEVCSAAVPRSPHRLLNPVFQKGLRHISSVHHLESRSIKSEFGLQFSETKLGRLGGERGLGQWTWPGLVRH